MDNYKLVEYTGLDRPEYILKNGKALNIYGAKKILEAQQQEIAELKAKLQSVKSDVIKTIISDINIGYANCELNCDDILDYLNGEETKLREGKS